VWEIDRVGRRSAVEMEMERLSECESSVCHIATSKSAPGECGGAVQRAEMTGPNWKRSGTYLLHCSAAGEYPR
jgi:hypothetical protein